MDAINITIDDPTKKRRYKSVLSRASLRGGMDTLMIFVASTTDINLFAVSEVVPSEQDTNRHYLQCPVTQNKYHDGCTLTVRCKETYASASARLTQSRLV